MKCCGEEPSYDVVPDTERVILRCLKCGAAMNLSGEEIPLPAGFAKSVAFFMDGPGPKARVDIFKPDTREVKGCSVCPLQHDEKLCAQWLRQLDTVACPTEATYAEACLLARGAESETAIIGG